MSQSSQKHGDMCETSEFTTAVRFEVFVNGQLLEHHRTSTSLKAMKSSRANQSLNYQEFIERDSWWLSESVKQWVSNRIIKEFIRRQNIDVAKTDLVEFGTGLGRGGFGYESWLSYLYRR